MPVLLSTIDDVVVITDRIRQCETRIQEIDATPRDIPKELLDLIEEVYSCIGDEARRERLRREIDGLDLSGSESLAQERLILEQEVADLRRRLGQFARRS